MHFNHLHFKYCTTLFSIRSSNLRLTAEHGGRTAGSSIIGGNDARCVIEISGGIA